MTDTPSSATPAEALPSRTAAPAPGDRSIVVDSEHFAIRLLVPILAVVATVVAHFAGLAVINLIDSEGTSPLCILLPLDLIVLLTSGMGIERVLKRLLPSRRRALLNDERVVLTDARSNPPEVREVRWDRLLNASTWYFVVQRRTRVPKGWYCMALHLLQDETDIIFYAFMPPKEAEALASFSQFVRLRPRKESVDTSDLRQIATQRRLLKLEDERWRGGAEIARADFAALMKQVERAIPGRP